MISWNITCLSVCFQVREVDNSFEVAPMTMDVTVITKSPFAADERDYPAELVFRFASAPLLSSSIIFGDIFFAFSAGYYAMNYQVEPRYNG